MITRWDEGGHTSRTQLYDCPSNGPPVHMYIDENHRNAELPWRLAGHAAAPQFVSHVCAQVTGTQVHSFRAGAMDKPTQPTDPRVFIRDFMCEAGPLSGMQVFAGLTTRPSFQSTRTLLSRCLPDLRPSSATLIYHDLQPRCTSIPARGLPRRPRLEARLW